MASAEEELESFRQQWRQEVLDKTKTKGRSDPSRPANGTSTAARPSKIHAVGPQPKTEIRHKNDPLDEFEGRTFHDLENKEDTLKLGNDGQRATAKEKEPKTALEHYEKAVEREATGSLQDSVNLYRQAFKLDDRVHEAYKAKHFPPSSFPSKPTKATTSTPTPTNTNPSNASPTVPNPAHHSPEGPLPTITELIAQFSQLSIPPAPPVTDLSPPPPCPISSLPEEILSEIFHHIALSDVHPFTQLALVCKRLAFLTMTEDRVWKRVTLGSEFGMGGMHYRYVCDLTGAPIYPSLHPPTILDLTPSTYPTYRAQFRRRPRLRFNGCYISTVNYTRPGASHVSRANWSSPVLIVSYWRYLRFFRDGTVISLLTTAEPVDVVHHMTWENCHKRHTGALPNAVMKDGLKGRWRLSGPAGMQKDVDGAAEYDALEAATTTTTLDGKPILAPPPMVAADEYGEYGFMQPQEEEGDVHIETEGVVPKYMWRMQFALGNAGRKDGSRNTKLSWKGFWSYNRLTDDWGEFGLKNDKAFYFSRVKSYGMGL